MTNSYIARVQFLRTVFLLESKLRSKFNVGILFSFIKEYSELIDRATIDFAASLSSSFLSPPGFLKFYN